MKKTNSAIESSFEISRKAWSDFLDEEQYENKPLVGNIRILKDKVTAAIDELNLPALDEATIRTTLWLEFEVERKN